MVLKLSIIFLSLLVCKIAMSAEAWTAKTMRTEMKLKYFIVTKKNRYLMEEKVFNFAELVNSQTKQISIGDSDGICQLYILADTQQVQLAAYNPIYNLAGLATHQLEGFDRSTVIINHVPGLSTIECKVESGLYPKNI